MSLEPDRRFRYGLLGAAPGMRSWGDLHPAAMAVVQGVVFGILFGILDGVESAHRPIGTDVASAVVAAVFFGLVMWVVNLRRRRADHE